jgi:uncharacterized protein YbjT (DUF2867 family)
MPEPLPRGARILVLGADGFIGRQIAFALRAEGFHIVASARRTTRLARMGFEVLHADLARPETSTPDFWRPHLAEIDATINCAGLLTGSGAALKAVHLTAPSALYKARPKTCRALLLSAVGIDQAQTSFACIRREAEEQALATGVTVLRAGLVLGETSHGGSSLARALAALPLAMARASSTGAGSHAGRSGRKASGGKSRPMRPEASQSRASVRRSTGRRR